MGYGVDAKVNLPSFHTSTFYPSPNCSPSPPSHAPSSFAFAPYPLPPPQVSEPQPLSSAVKDDFAHYPWGACSDAADNMGDEDMADGDSEEVEEVEEGGDAESSSGSDELGFCTEESGQPGCPMQ